MVFRYKKSLYLLKIINEPFNSKYESTRSALNEGAKVQFDVEKKL